MILKNGIAWRKGRESSLEILAQSLPSASLVYAVFGCETFIFSLPFLVRVSPATGGWYHGLLWGWIPISEDGCSCNHAFWIRLEHPVFLLVPD